jgi:hypothetical protein
MQDLLPGARLFVIVAFAILGLSFLAATATLAWEFGGFGWFDLAAVDSHLFIFFPTLGIAALCAFYVPSSVFVDMYWRHIAAGKLRFVAGFALIALFSWWFAQGLLASRHRSAWEIAPQVLAADRGEPADCANSVGPCQRQPVMTAIRNLRAVSGSRLGLEEFVRDCKPDRLLDPVGGTERRRFCFASTRLADPPRLQTDAECCRAQEKLLAAVDGAWLDPSRRSLTGRVHAALLPLKVFFLFILLAMSILLAVRYKGVERHYQGLMTRIEVGVVVGALVMMFFPLMSQAFLQSAGALVGQQGKGAFSEIAPLMTFGFGAWALLLLLFFWQRRDKEVEAVGKIAGVLASAIAVVKFNLIVALFERYFGSGASPLLMAVLALASLAAVIATFSPGLLSREQSGEES